MFFKYKYYDYVTLQIITALYCNNFLLSTWKLTHLLCLMSMDLDIVVILNFIF